MRYKVVKKTYIHNDKPFERFYIMYEDKVWYKKEPVWKHCREHTYPTMDSWVGDPVVRDSLSSAEDYIKLQMRIDNGDFDPQDIRIYECRDSKLDKILS